MLRRPAALLPALMLLNGFAAAPLRAEMPALLREAIAHRPNERGEWAYTFASMGSHLEGKSILTDTPEDAKETVYQFDPSKPYPEQYTPLKVNGHAPTPHDLEDYRKRGEKRGDRIMQRQKAAEKSAAPAKPAPPPSDKVPDSFEIHAHFLGDHSAKADLAAARVFAETPDAVTYEIPLRPGAPRSLPVDKMRILIRVSKARRRIEHASFTLLKPVRLLGIVRIKEVQQDLAAEPEGPDGSAVFFTHATVRITASVLFKTLHWSDESTWSDWRRVTPYDRQFGVKVGPMNLLGF